MNKWQLFLQKKNELFYLFKIKKFNTTFNNGSLGSLNDEERSEMR